VNQSDDDIIEIDGQKYLIPSRLVDGKCVRDPDSKIKLPIEMTSGLHINYGYKLPKPSLRERLKSVFTLGLL
jgi:hypothetical protein